MAELSTPNASKTFNCNKSIQTIELLPGRYKLEVWGAQGGTDIYAGGKGGYSSGEITLTTTTILYVVVGGQGATYTTAAGGYNGGGNGGSTHKEKYGAGGGGATHIATRTGLLKDLVNYQSSVLIVAGGGGGADGNGSSVGAGGGLEGTGTTTNQNPGTQTAGGKGGYTSSGSFGQGGNGGSNAGGGGGGWYGGSGGNASVGAPGGSGYIGGVQNGSTTTGQNTGNGKAVITCLSVANIELTTLNSKKEFNYTGKIESILLGPGTYKLEVWGAQGGKDTWSGSSAYKAGGLGGYSYGNLVLAQTTLLYVVVGGQGHNAQTTSGNGNGYNGGAKTSGHGSGGGGASHIATVSGLLNTLSSNKNDILIVAGGGGGIDYGGSHKRAAGDGGGGNALPDTAYGNNKQATATFGYQFGQGETPSTTNTGGGGGGYYGGYAGIDEDQGTGGGSSGGGGSAYLNNILQNTGGSKGQRTGNGFIRITHIADAVVLTVNKTPGIGNIFSNMDNLNNIPVGETVTLTAEILAGYTWEQWTGDFNGVQSTITFIMPDVSASITAHAIPRTDTPYVVQHHLMNLDGSTYTLVDTEALQGTTDVYVTPDVKTFTGFTSPSVKTAKINGNGSTVISYQYTRNKYTITVENGTSPKLQYYFEEIGSLHYTSMGDATLTFGQWSSDEDVTIYNAINKDCTFKMPAYDCVFFVVGIGNRLNSNIYKNIFPEPVIDLSFILQKMDNVLTSVNQVKQDNHGFEVNDVLYEKDGVYYKAQADKEETAYAAGIVLRVDTVNLFTFMRAGRIPYPHQFFIDTTILYLSDTQPGKLVHYQDITNQIYVPIAIYAEDSIIINIQNGSSGGLLFPYEEIESVQNFENYTFAELLEVINTIKQGDS